MAKARRVRGIKPRKGLRENAQRVISVRLEEVLSWQEALADPAQVLELHNMRIAAKRLRYALEIFDVCFPDSKDVLREVTGIQEDLGEIHDLDVLIDILKSRLHAREAEVERRAIDLMASNTSAADKGHQLRQLLYAQARDRRRIGLLGLIGDKSAERNRRFERFRRRWGDGRLDELRRQIRQATNGDEPERVLEPTDHTLSHTG